MQHSQGDNQPHPANGNANGSPDGQDITLFMRSVVGEVIAQVESADEWQNGTSEVEGEGEEGISIIAAESSPNKLHTGAVIKSLESSTQPFKKPVLLCGIIDRLDLEKETVEKMGIRLVQHRCFQQVENSSCGYYALHNAMVFLETYHRQGNRYSPNVVHQYLINGASFAKTFKRLNTELKVNGIAKGGLHYPWRSKDISSGLLEREYARFLLAEGKHPMLRKWRDHISVIPSLGIMEIMNGTLYSGTVKSLQDVFDRFQKPKESQNEDFGYQHGFLVGLTSHWISIMVTREAGQRSIDVHVLDSRNNPVLSLTIEEMDAFLNKTARPDLPEWRVFIRRKSYMDVVTAASIIARCAAQQMKFMTVYNHFVVAGFVKNFTNGYMRISSPETNRDVIEELIDESFRRCEVQSFHHTCSFLSDLVQGVSERENFTNDFVRWIQTETPPATFFSCLIHPLLVSGYKWTDEQDRRLIKVFVDSLKFLNNRAALSHLLSESHIHDLLSAHTILRGMGDFVDVAQN